MSLMELRIRALESQATLPSYAHPGDSGLDLCSAVDATLAPFERKTIPCGFALEIPEGFGGFVLPRSGLAAKCGISIVNAPGLVDSGYRGEVKVVLVNLDAHETFSVHRGDRIAQLVIMETPRVNLVLAEELDETARGEAGFGSSGV